ncbi:DUF2059 domain-containing protein [Parasediminibacterium sp. JCM 36343]|uniref:DUF2059 domain-containing protein n=1 Tax=Parasediminibacterium sp. JCM 36343 TaxID=3374279 RepID=UPI0039789FCA
MNRIIVFWVLCLSISSPIFSQTKKEKARQLVSILYGYQLVENQLKNEQTSLDKSFRDGSQKINDAAAYYKWRSCEIAFKKELFTSLYTNIKKRYTNIYDSIFTEGQIDKQLAFYSSENGRHFYKQFSGYVNPLQIFDFIFQDSSLSIPHFTEPKKQQKIDTLITLTMPKYLKNSPYA